MEVNIINKEQLLFFLYNLYMWYVFKKHLQYKRWNNRKIAFVSILIATSVAFILVFSAITPVVAVPSFKLMAGGLPVKLTGYIFGPLIGAITGALSDLISFLLRPTYFHWAYTFAWALAGLIPGIIGYFFNRKWRARTEIEKEFAEKHNLVNFIATLIILSVIMIGVFTMVWFAPNETFESKLIKDRNVFLVIALTGMTTMFFAIIIFRFTLRPKTFNAILPIVAFSALFEICVTPLITYGDMNSLTSGSEGSFVTILAGHMLLSPVKIWGNMIIILIAYRIVSPLIYSKQNNGWEE